MLVFIQGLFSKSTSVCTYTLFYKNLFLPEHEATKCPKFKNIPIMNIPKLRKGEELLLWILHEIMEIVCFSANVRQCNIAFGVVHVQLCFK